MKKTLLHLTILIGGLVVSCDTADLPQGKNANNDYPLIQKKSTMFSYIESIAIHNATDCKYDILIFPSWNKLWETADELDKLIDYDCDLFDATVPSEISDDKYETLANEAGFDEDNILINFEKDLGFCSLRKKIDILESDWLQLQGDGEWDIKEDPDNHFIFDETERTLFSENAEVIIGESKATYIYYKLISDHSWIEVHNWDLEAISQISNGTTPKNNPNVILKGFTDEKTYEKPSPCKKHVKTAKYHTNGSDRIKTKSKVINNSAWGAKKISALTVGYKKKRGKWKRSRTTITAGITGAYGTNNCILYQDCSRQFEKYLVKERKRRRVKAKFSGHRYEGASLIIGIQPQKAFSYHKQGSINLKMDYYEL